MIYSINEISLFKFKDKNINDGRAMDMYIRTELDRTENAIEHIKSAIDLLGSNDATSRMSELYELLDAIDSDLEKADRYYVDNNISDKIISAAKKLIRHYHKYAFDNSSKNLPKDYISLVKKCSKYGEYTKRIYKAGRACVALNNKTYYYSRRSAMGKKYMSMVNDVVTYITAIDGDLTRFCADATLED